MWHYCIEMYWERWLSKHYQGWKQKVSSAETWRVIEPNIRMWEMLQGADNCTFSHQIPSASPSRCTRPGRLRARLSPRWLLPLRPQHPPMNSCAMVTNYLDTIYILYKCMIFCSLKMNIKWNKTKKVQTPTVFFLFSTQNQYINLIFHVFILICL